MSQCPTHVTSPQLVRAAEAARFLAICTKTLRAITRRGDLPCVWIDAALRYDVDDLRSYIDRTKSGRPKAA